ncbi:50S ribosomal protein L31 [Fastidiosibacter lacustris]|uniref:50S ribosomal protein L31 n=1 Tax=Fastidiosibacter lacustris TaxID=2056695 RepID=UPI000E343529|nr:50S ribosomal protein L31 [Fastidiosibacter lacustris]
MNTEIQPKYEKVNVSCSCGNTFETYSTKCADINLDVCSMCHPFYTGKQRVVDTAGRVDSFQKRFGSLKSRKV